MLHEGGLQAKLRGNAHPDPREIEAERVAETMGPGARPSPALHPEIGIQRHINAASVPAAGRPDVPIEQVLNSPGQPLETGVRSAMQGRFGLDFGHVRVHTGQEAAQSAKSLDALAYTIGNHVVFDEGQYQPNSEPGLRLLAHELTHVAQQTRLAGGPPSEAAHEREADAATRSASDAAAHAEVKQAARPSLARLSVAEARRKLWGLLPEPVKPYVRPVAQAAAAKMDAVVPPTTELPKPVEAIVSLPVEAKRAFTDKPETPKAPPPKAPSQPLPGKPTAALKAIKDAAVTKVRDKVLGQIGEAKGVVLEATNIVDTVVWLSYAEHSVVKSALTSTLGKTSTAEGLLAAHDLVTGYSGIEQAANQFGLYDTDPITGEKGAPAISGAVSKAIDEQADKVEAAFGVPKEEPLVFTAYELGELKGAIETQVALAFVGVEEVQLVLKGLGLIGGIKGIVETIQRNPKGWHKDPNFWAGVLNAVLSVVGIKQARAARKLINIVIASGGALAAVPAIWQLYNDYTSTELASSPNRDKVLHRDLGNVIKILANVVAQVARHGAAPKPTAPTEGTGSGGRTGAPPELEGAPPQQRPPTPGIEGEPTAPGAAQPETKPAIKPSLPEVGEPRAVPPEPFPQQPPPETLPPEPKTEVPEPKATPPESKPMRPEPETKAKAPQPEPKAQEPEPKALPPEPETKPKIAEPEPKAPEAEPKAAPPEPESRPKAVEPEPKAPEAEPKAAPTEAQPKAPEPEQKTPAPEPESEAETKPKASKPESKPAEPESEPKPPQPDPKERIARMEDETRRLSDEAKAQEPKVKEAMGRRDKAEKEAKDLGAKVHEVQKITKEAVRKNPELKGQYEWAEKLRDRFKRAEQKRGEAEAEYARLKSEQDARYDQIRRNRAEVERLSRPELELPPTERGRVTEERVLREEGLLGIKKEFTLRDPKTGEMATTIPDAVRPNGRTVDVKDVAELSETQQLRLQREVSRRSGQKAEIITGTKTKVPAQMERDYLIRRRPDLGPQ